MFKKIMLGFSAAAVLVTSASAMDFCKTADNLFLKNGLQKIYSSLKPNQSAITEACDNGNYGSPACQGQVKAAEILANNVFTSSGYDAALTMLNKFGVKRQYTKAQIFVNYQNFFAKYLKNKLEEMRPQERRIFLEKFFFFFNRVPDNIIVFNKEKLNTGFLALLFTRTIKKLPPRHIINNANENAVKEFLHQGDVAYTANTQLKGVNAVEGEAILAFHPLQNLKQVIKRKDQWYSSKNSQIGGNADNIQKFFVYAATRQYDKAFNLINNTYSNKFVEDFNKLVKEACNIK